MDAISLRALLSDALPDCDLEVTGEGANYQIRAVGAVFGDMSRVRRQQHVYAALTALIQSGEVHAVTIVAQTPEEAAG